MRHRRQGRKLGRKPNHQRALLRNLASALFLTERNAEGDDNAPKVKGRIITTLPKAKEVRPLIERCIAIACRAVPRKAEAEKFATTAERHSEQWVAWRKSDEWRQWAKAMAPVVAARRRVLRLLGDKTAVRVLFEEVSGRFVDRKGGYTRILKLASPRLGDAAPRAIIEFVGTNDRQRKKSFKPTIETDVAAPVAAVAPVATPDATSEGEASS
jgi:large subunit ribosomal protein L17